MSEGDAGSGERIDCDLLVTAVGWTAPTSLLNMAGDRPVYSDGRRPVPSRRSRPPDACSPTGGLAGDGSLDELVEHGPSATRPARPASRSPGGGRAPVAMPELAGRYAPGAVPVEHARDGGLLRGRLVQGHRRARRPRGSTPSSWSSGSRPRPWARPRASSRPSTSSRSSPRPTEHDREHGDDRVAPAVRSDHPRRPRRAKLRTGAVLADAAVARAPTAREPLVAGDWIRPDHYGDPEAEVRNVRAHVGIIDVTPLGKLDLRGPDVAELLNLLYVNRWSKLAVGARPVRRDVRRGRRRPR